MSRKQRKNIPKTWQDVVPLSSSKISTKKTRRRPLRAAIQYTQQHIKKLSKRKKMVVVLILTAVAITVAGLLYVNKKPETKSAQNEGQPFTAAQLPQGTPEYDTVLPTGKTINNFGGWTRVSPSTADPVYAYVDTVAGSPIRVSQQPLPDGFEEDTAEQVSSLAQDLGANKVLNVGETIVYIGTSAKGPQSIVLTKNKLLILIRSSVVIANSDWAAYISSLN